MKKARILFLQPLFYDPTLPNFKDKFEMLSSVCRGYVISVSDKPLSGEIMGEFVYQSLPYIQNKVLRYIRHFFTIISLGTKFNKHLKFDFLVSYDPLFFGVSAVVLKWLTRARVVMEINGHLGEAAFIQGGDLRQNFKRKLICSIARMCLKNADIVKCLNQRQVQEWSGSVKARRVFIFSDFVPTHIFDPAQAKDDRYVLFVGHPFHLKGVDILIAAFLKIADKFPDIRLKIIGHCHGGDLERTRYIKMANHPRVEILKPVSYPDIVRIFQNCTFFVLPSRSEAMGRVLIEAMASGKAVLGSRVGGIPDVIEDGKNGFLFECGDAEDLAVKMEKLLSDENLRIEMGQRGKEVVDEKFSSHRYVQNFSAMIR